MLPPAPLAAERPLCFHETYLPYFSNREPCAESPLRFWARSFRSPSRENASIIFRVGARTESYQWGPDLLYARPRMRDIFAAEHRLTRVFLERHHARATSELAGWRFSFRFLFLVLVLYGLYQVKTVPYCSYMITFMHKTTIHKKTPS